MLHLLEPCFARLQQSQTMPMVQAMLASDHDVVKPGLAGLATAL